MPQYSPPRKILAVYGAVIDFINSINDESKYEKEEYRKEVLRKFNHAREENRLTIEEKVDILEYIRNLSSEEVKLRSVYRRMRTSKNDEELIGEKNKLSEWFQEQEGRAEEIFRPYIFDD